MLHILEYFENHISVYRAHFGYISDKAFSLLRVIDYCVFGYQTELHTYSHLCILEIVDWWWSRG